MTATKQIKSQRRALRFAQKSLCAGCGMHLPGVKRVKRFDPNYPTFDHIQPKSAGGGRTLSNGLLKHQRCNQARGNAPANGCDRVWADVVAAGLKFLSASMGSQPKTTRE